MQLETLKVSTRSMCGTGPARRLRNQGEILGVIYGEGKEPLPIRLNGKEFLKLVQDAGAHALVEVDILDSPESNGPTMLKAIQRHPVYGHVLHVDFFRIDLSKRIHTVARVSLTGHAVGVVHGGVLEHQLRELEIECFALDVPDSIEVDLSAIDIGDSVHVSDIEIPENVTVLTPSDRVVAAVHAPKVVIEETPEEEVVEEGEEGEGVEGAEGAEGADGDKEASESESKK